MASVSWLSHIKFNFRKLIYKFTMSKDILKPPSLEGLKLLDKSLFTKNIDVLGLKLPQGIFEKVLPIIKPIMLKLPKFKAVTHGTNITVLLNPETISTWDDIDSKIITKLESLGITNNNVLTQSITLTYDNYNVNDIMRSIIPQDMEIARGFAVVGHILHVNLRECLFPYKQIIGEVLLDKTPNIKSVVNKTTTIDNTFRNFQMELICGIDIMITKVKENGVTFEFDFSKVYWNSRLSTEHLRIVNLLQHCDVLFDVFSGVGPFAIPAAKKGCTVYANDLNPQSYKWLNHNISLNKACNITTFNKDGRQFIKENIKNYLLSIDSSFEGKIHIAMNLPAIALEFIQHFNNLINPSELQGNNCLTKITPIVHIYFFVSGTDLRNAAIAEFYRVTNLSLLESELHYYYVRNVSPSKDMVRLTFNLPLCYLVEQPIDGPPAKRICGEKDISKF